MAQILGGGRPPRDDRADAARLAAEQRAAEERQRLETLRREEDSARRRGLRGIRSLLSEAGEGGFKTTLGG